MLNLNIKQDFIIRTTTFVVSSEAHYHLLLFLSELVSDHIYTDISGSIFKFLKQWIVHLNRITVFLKHVEQFTNYCFLWIEIYNNIVWKHTWVSLLEATGAHCSGRSQGYIVWPWRFRPITPPSSAQSTIYM